MYLTQQMQPRAMIESTGTERNYLKKEKHSSFIYFLLRHILFSMKSPIHNKEETDSPLQEEKQENGEALEENL